MNQLKCVHLPIYLDLKIKYMETILNIPIVVEYGIGPYIYEYIFF